MTAPNKPIELQIHLDGVVAPAQQAAVVCKEIVDFYFASLERADLSKRPEAPGGKFFVFGFKTPEMSAEQRRAVHEAWVLAKAFQDLMRGVRASLEEAYFVTELLAAGQMTVKTASTLEEVLRPFKDKAASMKFPPLLSAVNARLEKPLEFSEAYRSMQAARNCLEHRNGIVGVADAQTGGKMILQFPRLKMFIVRNNEEVEVHPNMPVKEGEAIGVKVDVRKREFALGERLSISATDFDEVAFACSQFATELGQSLSKKLVPPA